MFCSSIFLVYHFPFEPGFLRYGGFDLSFCGFFASKVSEKARITRPPGLKHNNILDHLSAKEHLLIINLEGEGPLCLVGARFLPL